MRVIVWRFHVHEPHREAFEHAYGSEGDWAACFERQKGYLSTQLLHDQHKSSRYLTIDRWESRESFEAFQKSHAVEYETLDQRFAALTMDEVSIGIFDEL